MTSHLREERRGFLILKAGMTYILERTHLSDNASWLPRKQQCVTYSARHLVPLVSKDESDSPTLCVALSYTHLDTTAVFMVSLMWVGWAFFIASVPFGFVWTSFYSIK
jgi:hypothetical protein